MLNALRRLHAQGLIHKDIKPANVLVHVGTGKVWLTGFGLTSRLPRERQAPAPPEVIAGTLVYMAPEQTGRMNRSVDARSDLYALGVTLYEMLTGALPFTAGDPMAWILCHIARPPMPPGERERIHPLAQLVQEKTAGNPFFAIQFIAALAEEGLLAFDPDAAAWTWDLARIRAKGYTDNVVDLLVGKLNRLPAAPREALQRLACLGNRAQIATLTMVQAVSEEEIHAALWEAVRAGLVFRLDGAYTFLHDRVQEAAYALVADEERQIARGAQSIREIRRDYLRHRQSAESGHRADHLAGGARAGRRAQSHGRQARQDFDGLCSGTDVFRCGSRAAGRGQLGAAVPTDLRSRVPPSRMRIPDR